MGLPALCSIAVAFSIFGLASTALGSEETAPTPGQVCKVLEGGKKRGKNMHVVINKRPKHRLSANWEPSDLVSIPRRMMMPGRNGQVRRKVLPALKKMLRAAKRKGLRLNVRSAYRSFHTQCVTYESKVRKHGKEHAMRYSAKPGHSQHQLGTTVDISAARLDWTLSDNLAKTREGRWLARNASRFGFVLSYPKNREKATGYAFEPWHFRYVGKKTARKIEASRLVPDAYLSACTGKRKPRKCMAKKRRRRKRSNRTETAMH